MSKPIPRRLLAWLLAAMVAFVVAPSAAFANDLTGGVLSTQDETAWSDIADDTVVFTMQAAKADGSVTSKAFTKGDMETMSQANTTPAKYAYSSKSGASLSVSTKYVTVDQLLSAAGFTFAENDSILGWSDSFTPNSTTPFEGFASRKFFPAYDPGASTQNADGAEVVPGIIAIEYGTVSIDSGTTAASHVDDAIAASAYQTSGKNAGLRNFWGKTDDELNGGNMGGNSYCSGCTYLTVSTPFKIYTRTGTGEKELVKAYTAASLNSLATTPASAETAPGFLFNKGGWQVGTTTSYIPIEKLMSDAGITLSDNVKLAATASDNFTSYLTYDQIKNAKYFYPETTSSAIVATSQEEVGAVLALNWAVTGGEYADGSKNTFPTVDASGTAANAKASMFELSDKFNAQTRIFVGLTSATDENTGGNRFATGPVEISVVTMKDINDASITVSGVEESYDYTGSAIEPAITVKDGDTTLSQATRKGGDYEVSYENNVEVGTGKVIITGVNAYSGTREIEFKIAGIDLSSADVAVDDATYTGAAIEPEPTVKLGDTTLEKGTDYTVAYQDNTNAGTATVVITGTGIYAGEVSKTFAINPVELTAKTVSVSVSNPTYTGKKQTPAPTVKLGGTTLKKGTDYTVAYSNNINANTKKSSVKIVGKGNYAGTVTQLFSILKADNTMKASAKANTNKVAYKSLQKKKQVIAGKNAFNVKKAQGAVVYKKASGNAKIAVNASTGNITVKKGLAKGTYKVKVKVTAKGDQNYKKLATDVVLTIKVS